MKKPIRFTVSLLVGFTIVAIGLGGGLAQADPTGNNGNHYGNGQNGNNGNHYGWYKQNGQSSQNLQYNSIQNATNGTSVPEPASLVLLGAGLTGIGIWRRMSRKV